MPDDIYPYDTGSKYAFSSTADCPMPPVVRIPCDLVEDCIVPPPPDPTFEAPTAPVNIPTPTFGCICPSINATVNVGTFNASVTAVDGDCCDLVYDFNLHVPTSAFGCTIITPKVNRKDANVDVQPVVDLTVVPQPDEPEPPLCEQDLEFEIEIGIPCNLHLVNPNSTVGNNANPGAGTFDLEIKKTTVPGANANGISKCKYSYKFDINFPKGHTHLCPSSKCISSIAYTAHTGVVTNVNPTTQQIEYVTSVWCEGNDVMYATAFFTAVTDVGETTDSSTSFVTELTSQDLVFNVCDEGTEESAPSEVIVTTGDVPPGGSDNDYDTDGDGTKDNGLPVGMSPEEALATGWSYNGLLDPPWQEPA